MCNIFGVNNYFLVIITNCQLVFFEKILTSRQTPAIVVKMFEWVPNDGGSVKTFLYGSNLLKHDFSFMAHFQMVVSSFSFTSDDLRYVD